MKTIYAICTGLMLFISFGFAYAVEENAKKATSEAKTSAAKLPMTAGEITKVDKDAGKVTIKHGEIKNLDMPPMTMMFRMSDPAMLEKIKAGDKINFLAEKIKGNFTVTEFERVNQ
jgi:Cu(I)/Ag(I) efflux system periplasmic protein CusF